MTNKSERLENIEIGQPDKTADCKALFGFDCDFEVPAYSQPHPLVPEIDDGYIFDPETTKAILAGFAFNRRVLLQGLHGTGKSSHLEQVAARLNWPCLRINLDSHISRIDLLGKDVIRLEDGKQVTTFEEGLLPWAIQNPCALVFDEYDAGRPDVMFVIQRILESDGQLTLLDSNKVITPNTSFRLFATANTVGLGDTTGLYHGTQAINQGQMDRWHIVAALNDLPEETEVKIVKSKLNQLNDIKTTLPENEIKAMVRMAGLTRTGFQAGDISTLMSPRTVVHWAQNTLIFNDLEKALSLSFLNKCDEAERPIIAEYFQRCFNKELIADAA